VAGASSLKAQLNAHFGAFARIPLKGKQGPFKGQQLAQWALHLEFRKKTCSTS